MSLRYLTAGESHGKALMGILEGIPSGLSITQENIQFQMRRRKLGFGRGARQQIETDQVEIISGIRFGKTLGSPIGLSLENKDWISWKEIMQVGVQGEAFQPVKKQVSIPRPGHADWIGGLKYQHSDLRNVLERSSARETAMRVALGSIAIRFLEELGISIASRVLEIGGVADVLGSSAESFAENSTPIPVREINSKVDSSPVRCLNPEAASAMVRVIEKAKKEGNTLGGVFEISASGIPIGLGSYSQWDRRLEGQIGQAFLSLNAIKGVEVGLGFRASQLQGSQVHDEIFPSDRIGKVTFKTNRSGGIDGGMTTGQNLVVRAAMKPLSTLMSPLSSVDLRTGEAKLAHVERSDVCAVPSAAVIGESLLALILSQSILEKFGGDSMREVIQRVQEWNRS